MSIKIVSICRRTRSAKGVARCASFLVVALAALGLNLGCSSEKDGAKADASNQSFSDSGLGRVDAMVSQSTVGGSCSQANDCSDPPDADCFTDEAAQFGIVYPGGYCSKGCRAERDEPAIDCGTGACITASSTGGGGSQQQSFCAKTCTTDDECRIDEGYRCKMLPFGLGGYCDI